MSGFNSFSHNLCTLKKNGSLIFCKSCNKIIGSVNPSGYRLVHLSLRCDCETTGSLLLSRSKDTNYEKVDNTPYYEDGVYICKNCKTPMFSIIKNRLLNYSFYAVCKCGAKYDKRIFHNNKHAETVNLIKKL